MLAGRGGFGLRLVPDPPTPNRRHPDRDAGDQRHDRHRPRDQVESALGRLEQDPLAVAIDEERPDLVWGLARAELRRDLGPHLPGERRRRVGDRQVQAHGAAEPGGDLVRAVGDRFAAGPTGRHQGREPDHGHRPGDEGDRAHTAAHSTFPFRSAVSMWSVSQSYVTAPVVFAEIVPSGAITNVSGTPNTPYAIAAFEPGSSASGQSPPSSSRKAIAASGVSSNETPSTTTPRSRYRSHAASSAGCSTRHGMHRACQKFTTRT